MAVRITGGADYIGSRTALRLIEEGFTPIVTRVDRIFAGFDTPRRVNPVAIGFRKRRSDSVEEIADPHHGERSTALTWNVQTT